MDTVSFKELMKEGISLAILLPIVWYFIRSNEKSQTAKFNLLAKTMKDGFILMTSAFKTHETAEFVAISNIHASINEANQLSAKNFASLGMKLGNTVLNKEQTVNLLLSNMWMVSYGKLEYIRNILKINHIDGRRTEIRKKVKAELSRKSTEYMKTFSEYLTPIGDLSEWLNKTFDEKAFEAFLDEILERMYTKEYSRHTTDVSIELQVNDIATLMKELQNNLAAKLRSDIENN